MMLVRLVLLPLLSLGGIGLASWSVHTGNVATPPVPGLSEPPASPFATRVSATGVVEAKSRNIGLGVARPGLVTELRVDIGSQVAAGDVLLQIDAREPRARLLARQAELASAEAEVARLRSLPRIEEVQPRESFVQQRKSQLAEAEAMQGMVQRVTDPRAVSREEATRRQIGVDFARNALAEAEAQLSLLRAGVWAPDLAIAEAKVAIAKAAAETVQAELEQLTLRAPFAGKVLQVNLRVGEYAIAGGSAQPALVLGDVSTLHVRADVDEMDVWRLRADAPARAYVRGNPSLSAPLQFVAIEPLMIPKRSLSGGSREQVDTRVLQVLFALDPQALPVQVGQLVDVWIEAAVPPGGGK